MLSRLLPLTLFSVVLLLAVSGCGEGGGCGPEPEKKGDSGGGGGSAPSSKGGGGGGGATAPELITADKRGRVPKPYRRPGEAPATGAPAAQGGAPLAAAAKKVTIRVTQRRMNGIADRVEIVCGGITAAAADKRCASAPNYAEIQELCCPRGTIERCTTTGTGVVIVGRGCDPAKR